MVQVLGVVGDSLDAPAHVISEHTPLSLYDALHRDRISLARHEIALIATHILHGLQFLHARGEDFGSSLTSRKVVLDGSNKVKLRRFGLEFVQRHAATKRRSSNVPETSSFWKTQYELSSIQTPEQMTNDAGAPSLASGTGLDAKVADAKHDQEMIGPQKQDLYAFGVLLLEMCTSEKPSSEMYNRISRAQQVDPVFGQIVRLALACGGFKDDDDADRKNGRFSDPGVEASAACFIKLLTANERERGSEETRKSSASFPSFLHADRYFVATEAEQIEKRLQSRDSTCEVAAKRLVAVEQELLDEQSNFEVLVNQFEQSQQEKSQYMHANSLLDGKIQALVLANAQANDEGRSLASQVARQTQRLDRLQMCMEDYINHILRLQNEKAADMKEKQDLLMEILKLKEEKRKLHAEQVEAQKQCATLAAKVGGEKDALEDLDGRYRQTIFKWEQEQKARHKAERQNEALNSQLAQMEEERSVYSFALNHCPTGLLDPKHAADLVLDLKTKEIRVLRDHVEERIRRENDLQVEIAAHEQAFHDVSKAQQQLQGDNAELQAQQQALTEDLAARNQEIANLAEQLRRAAAQIQVLNEKIADFEEELERQRQTKVDEGQYSLYAKLYRTSSVRFDTFF